MRVSINGVAKEIDATTIGALLEELDYGTGHVAVALNQDVVPRTRWNETPIQAGDDIEILSPRQGG
ncbi:MAG: sulfur carrier protein ThiS [Alphaproteobacteria bacterium]|nr:sulfur carrier protein ThiS [Alphaproteobacteria bacterium]